jgi:outer membrane protein insertion porin family
VNTSLKFYLQIIFVFLLITAVHAQEEDKYELVDFLIEGNSTLDTYALQKIITTEESSSWFGQFLNSFSSFGGPAVYLDTIIVKDDIELLKSFYRYNGFFEAEVKYEYTLDHEDREASLKYIIDEKTPFSIREIQYTGVDSIRGEFRAYIRELTEVDTADRYRGEKIGEMREEILLFLRDKGYMLANINAPTVLVDTIKNKVSVDFKINTGRRYIVNDVRITKSGNNKDLVNDELLKNIVAADTGEYYEYSLLKRGQVRLYRTGLFNSALVTGVIADTTNDKVPVNINVDVGLLYEITPEIILNDEDATLNIGLGVGFTRKNFLGDARKFTIRTSAASKDIREFLANPSISDTTVFGYADARTILEQPILFGYNVFTKWENYATVQKRKDQWNTTIFGSKISFNVDLPKFVWLTSLTTYFNWENSKYVYHDNFVSSTFSDYLSQSGDNDLSSIFQDTLDLSITSQSNNAVFGFQIGADKTDNFVFPTQGYVISILFEDGNSLPWLWSKAFGGKFKEPQYLKLNLNSSYFIPFPGLDLSSIGFKFRIGNIQTYRGDKSKIPINQRFYAGGSNSVRGWRTRELVPKVELPLDNVDVSALTPAEFERLFLEDAAPGGFFIIEGSVESRIRLFEKIGSAVFFDFGNTWNKPNNFKWNNIAAAVGFGFRYYSEYIPVRIDFGFKAYDPGDKTDIFQKNFLNNLIFYVGIGEAF